MARIAVIGVGAFGVAHLRAYLESGADVVGIADADQHRVAAVAAEFGIPRFDTDGFTLIDEVAPEGVSVVTAADSHLPLALHAVRRGCRVLLEKPVATMASELTGLPPEAAALILPGHVLRFEPVHRRLHELVQSGAIGEVVAISASRSRASWHVQRYPDVHPALLTAIHDIDLAVWMSGSTAVSLTANELRTSGAPNPDVVFAQVTAANGSIWSIRTAWTLPATEGPSDLFEVFGTTGVATVTVDAAGTTLALPAPGHRVLHVPPQETPGLAAEIDYFLELIHRQQPPTVVTLREAAQVVSIAQAMIDSGRDGGRPVLVASVGSGSRTL